MKSERATTDRLAEKIGATEERLQALNKELKAIGEPVASGLRNRIAAIEVEEHALQRNFAEVMQGETRDEEKVRKVETLLHHIETEEAALEHEADFLHRGAPTTLAGAYWVGSRISALCGIFFRKIMGKHRITLPHSPFVNTSISTLDQLRKDADETGDKVFKT